MKPYEIKKGIYWVGAIDWNVKNFHGRTYTIKRGTTYNAYLIIDDKIALVDTVYGPFAAEMIERIKNVIDPAKIDYIIANHVEQDHTGALPAITKLCPKAKILGTQKCKEGLYRNYYENWDFQVVKTNDKLKLGKRTLTFIEAPMIHWPDSMFTYCAEEELLLPNDAFGQHYATDRRFADEVDQAVLMEETVKYYANILWPLSSVISRKIEEIRKLNLSIKMIAPSHGVIWRKDPVNIIEKYYSWSKNETRPKVVIVYETMWGSTEKMAREIADTASNAGIDVKLFEINQSDSTEIITEMFSAKGYIIGSSTHDNDMLPTLSGFLELLKGFKPKNRIACAFGSYGWAGGAVKEIENALKVAGIEVVQPSLGVQYVPDDNDLKKCSQWAIDFVNKCRA